MKTYKRPLTQRQARTCEHAKKAKCVCRCGGRLHGGSHEAYMFYERQRMDTIRKLGWEPPDLVLTEVQHLVRMVAGLPGLEAAVANAPWGSAGLGTSIVP